MDVFFYGNSEINCMEVQTIWQAESCKGKLYYSEDLKSSGSDSCSQALSKLINIYLILSLGVGFRLKVTFTRSCMRK